MSVYYALVCHETKQTVWVGQGGPTMRTFCRGEPDTMERLGKFLEATQGKPLVLLADYGGDELEDYEEFGA